MITPPDPALAAARRLRDHGEHVHLVSEAHSRCLSGHCHNQTGTPEGDDSV